jgi:hypothetical protein
LYTVKVLLNPTDRKKERKLLMIFTVALLNGPFIGTTGKLTQVSKIKKEIEDTMTKEKDRQYNDKRKRQ